MTANQIGKGLVLVHFALSLVALSWAVALFFQFTDYGWKEPRGELFDKQQKAYAWRVPSELDKRIAALLELQRNRDRVFPGIDQAWKPLKENQEKFPDNHLFYQEKLNLLYNSKDPIDVPEIKMQDGQPVLDIPGKLGKPVLEKPLPNVKKSWPVLVAELRDLNLQSKAINEEVQKIVEETAKITSALNGLNDDGKQDRPGLYDLLLIEAKTQADLRYELEDIRQRRYDALKDAEIFQERKARLEEDLKYQLKLRGGN